MKTTRRSFVSAAGALSASVLVRCRPGAAIADGSASATPDAGARATVVRLDAGTQPDGGQAAQAPGAIAQLARERYGKFLDDKQLKLLDAKLGEIEARGKRLHAFKLTNGKEPACEFRPVRP